MSGEDGCESSRFGADETLTNAQSSPPPPFPLWRSLQGGLRGAGSWAGLRGRGCPAFSSCAARRSAQRRPPSPGTERGVTCPPSARRIGTAHRGPRAGRLQHRAVVPAGPPGRAGAGTVYSRVGWGGVGWEGAGEKLQLQVAVSRTGQARPCPGRARLRSGPAAALGVSRAETGSQSGAARPGLAARVEKQQRGRGSYRRRGSHRPRAALKLGGLPALCGYW